MVGEVKVNSLVIACRNTRKPQKFKIAFFQMGKTANQFCRWLSRSKIFADGFSRWNFCRWIFADGIFADGFFALTRHRPDASPRHRFSVLKYQNNLNCLIIMIHFSKVKRNALTR